MAVATFLSLTVIFFGFVAKIKMWSSNPTQPDVIRWTEHGECRVRTSNPNSCYHHPATTLLVLYLTSLELPHKFTEADWRTSPSGAHTPLLDPASFYFTKANLKFIHGSTWNWSSNFQLLFCQNTVAIKTNLKYTFYNQLFNIHCIGVCFSKARPQV